VTNPFYAVIGAGGCGRGVMPLARQQLAAKSVPADRLVFIDDAFAGGFVNGHQVLTHSQFMSEPASARYAVIAVANSRIREQINFQCHRDNIKPWSVTAPNVVILDDVSLGEGSVLCPFVTLTSNIIIGAHFHANLYSYVEHDCVLGDFVTFAPGVKCNGNVQIGNHVYIGAGAIIRQGLPSKPLVIGSGALIGMGAVVTKDVPADTVVVGNPARPLIRKPN